jgi:hypothetical protein
MGCWENVRVATGQGKHVAEDSCRGISVGGGHRKGPGRGVAERVRLARTDVGYVRIRAHDGTTQPVPRSHLLTALPASPQFFMILFCRSWIATISFRSEPGLMLPFPFLKFRIVHSPSLDRRARRFVENSFACARISSRYFGSSTLAYSRQVSSAVQCARDSQHGRIGRRGLFVIIETDPSNCDHSRANVSFQIELADQHHSL